MRLFYVFLLASTAWCQSGQPNCEYRYRFTNRTGETADGAAIFSPGAGPTINNFSTVCSGWQLQYSNEGFSALSITLQSAPRTFGGSIGSSSPGAWSTFSGSDVVGALPLTSTSGDRYIGTGYFPFIRVNLTSTTGTGSVEVVLQGWKSNNMVAFGTGTTINPKIMSNILFADRFAGADCGAKINAAFTSLGSTPGEVWVNQNCGTTWTTAVTIAAKQTLKFIQGGTYNISALITNGGHIISDIAAIGWETTGTGNTILKQTNSVNLAKMILLNTEAASVEGGIEIDGNKANNSTAQDCIDITDARGTLLENLFLHDCKRHGIYIDSTSANLAAVPVLRHVVSYNNGTDGLRVENTTDLVVGVFSEFEANGGNGIRLIDSPGARIEHSDVAGNALPGLFITGTVGGQHSHLTQVVGNQFGNNVQEDIYIDGTATATYVTEGNVITGNVFYGGTNRSNLTYPAVRVKDTAQNTIGPNVFNDTAAHIYTYGIQEDNTLGKIGSNSYVGNNFFFAGGETGTIGSLAASLSFYCVDGNGLCAAAQMGIFYNAGVAGSGQFFLGGYPGAANVAQWTFNPNVTVSTVLGNLYGVAYSGNAFVETDNQAGDKGILGRVVPASYGSATNCSSSASPAVCGSAAAGSVTIAAGATTKVVNTTAVTANSQIILETDSSLGTKLSVTCNTQSSLTLGTPRVTARTGGTSFTIAIEVGPTTNPLCISYYIIN